MPARRAAGSQLASSASSELVHDAEIEREIDRAGKLIADFTSRPALAYWLNVHQLCDGDLTYLERKQAEQRLIAELG